jgi:16S rRNA (adenine1518-N6/adenine1519-N6)-dimethyltransferase
MAGRKLGQHFLFNTTILRRIVEAACISPTDLVVEIGPGPGTLTALLSEAAGKVIAIELDADLHGRLKDHLPGNVELCHGDALRYPYEKLDPFVVVANIPYYITTPLIFRLMESRENLRSMTLTIQKEVAERIVAGPGTKTYGVLSVAVQIRSTPTMKFIVPRGAFRPIPEVDSAVICIDMTDEPRVALKDEQFFLRVVRAAFSQRRKTLANSLKALFPDARAHLAAVGIDSNRRAETLSIEEFARLADSFSDSP